MSTGGRASQPRQDTSRNPQRQILSCLNCRVRRKSCPGARTDGSGCEACYRLRFSCLGFPNMRNIPFNPRENEMRSFMDLWIQRELVNGMSIRERSDGHKILALYDFGYNPYPMDPLKISIPLPSSSLIIPTTNRTPNAGTSIHRSASISPKSRESRVTPISTHHAPIDQPRQPSSHLLPPLPLLPRRASETSQIAGRVPPSSSGSRRHSDTPSRPETKSAFGSRWYQDHVDEGSGSLPGTPSIAVEPPAGSTTVTRLEKGKGKEKEMEDPVPSFSPTFMPAFVSERQDMSVASQRAGSLKIHTLHMHNSNRGFSADLEGPLLTQPTQPNRDSTSDVVRAANNPDTAGYAGTTGVEATNIDMDTSPLNTYSGSRSGTSSAFPFTPLIPTPSSATSYGHDSLYLPERSGLVHRRSCESSVIGRQNRYQPYPQTAGGCDSESVYSLNSNYFQYLDGPMSAPADLRVQAFDMSIAMQTQGLDSSSVYDQEPTSAFDFESTIYFDHTSNCFRIKATGEVVEDNSGGGVDTTMLGQSQLQPQPHIPEPSTQIQTGNPVFDPTAGTTNAEAYLQKREGQSHLVHDSNSWTLNVASNASSNIYSRVASEPDASNLLGRTHSLGYSQMSWRADDDATAGRTSIASEQYRHFQLDASFMSIDGRELGASTTTGKGMLDSSILGASTLNQHNFGCHPSGSTANIPGFQPLPNQQHHQPSFLNMSIDAPAPSYQHNPSHHYPNLSSGDNVGFASSMLSVRHSWPETSQPISSSTSQLAPHLTINEEPHQLGPYFPSQSGHQPFTLNPSLLLVPAPTPVTPNYSAMSIDSRSQNSPGSSGSESTAKSKSSTSGVTTSSEGRSGTGTGSATGSSEAAVSSDRESGGGSGASSSGEDTRERSNENEEEDDNNDNDEHDSLFDGSSLAESQCGDEPELPVDWREKFRKRLLANGRLPSVLETEGEFQTRQRRISGTSI